MQLSSTQRDTLKAAIIADVALASARASRDTQAIADYLNAASSYLVWRTSLETADVLDAIVWSNLTPIDPPDGSMTWLCRSLACQGKQLSLQIMLQGVPSVKPAKANFRAGLQDALTNVPAGAGGALIAAGWAAVKNAMQRPATRLEQLYASGSGTAASPGSLTVEGSVDELVIRQLAWSDTGDWLL